MEASRRRGAPPRMFDTPEGLGAYAAGVILRSWEAALASRGVVTLGCPAGRSLRTTYDALAARIDARVFDGACIHLVMMDDYIEPCPSGWRRAPGDAHYSCERFGETHILGALNRGLVRAIPRANLHVPDPACPSDYEETIRALGGIDIFLLASGASDGHVAFNPPGTPLCARTRRIRLAEATRMDNLDTFPAFRSLEEVPSHGVSVGPQTIVDSAGKALLVLIGREKREAVRWALGTDRYDPSWPATVVHACREAEILIDRAAADLDA